MKITSWRKALQNLPIRRKLMAILMLTSGVALLLACSAAVIYDWVASRKMMAESLGQIAEVIGKNSAAALAFGDAKAAEDTVAGLRDHPDIIFAGILTPNRQWFVRFARGDFYETFPPPESLEERSYFAADRLILIRPILLDQERVGAIYLVSDLSGLRSRLSRFSAIVGLIFVLSCFAAFALSTKLQGLISTPILDLARTAKAVSIGRNYSIRAERHGGDEVGVLIDGFNEMLTQIQERDQNLERAIATRTAELMASEERVRLILDSAAEAIYGQDLEGKCTFCNASFLRLLGYDRQEDLLGRNMHRLIHHTRPDGTPYPLEDCRINQAYRDGIPSHVDDEVVWRADGTGLPVEYWSYPIRQGKEIVGSVVTFVDITERKRAEEELYQSRNMIQSILDNIPQRVFWKNRNINYLGCNRAFALDAGLGDPAEIVGKNDFDLSWKETAELHRKDDRLVMEQETPKLNFEEPLAQPDGSRHWLRTNKLPLRDRAGQVIGVLGTYEDITEQKRAEQAQRQSDERLSSVIESSHDWVWEVDANGVYTYSSPRVKDLLGYSPEEVIGKTPFDFMTTDEAKRIRTEFAEFARDRRTFRNIENVNLHKNGGEVILETTGAPIFDADGNLTGFRGIDRDVTERKQAEEQNRLQAVALENAANAVVMADTEGTILWVNPAFTSLTGYVAGEVVGKNPRVLKSGRQNREFYANLWQTIKSGQVWRGDLVNRKKDGSFYSEEMTIAPIRDQQQAITRFVAIKQDISESKRAEEALRQAKEAAEAANRAKSEFLANMSHEIRTPMNGIMGMTDLALETDLTVEQREYLSTVKKSAESLLCVINDILDFSKIEAGKIELSPMEFSPRETVEDAVRALALRAEEKGLEISCRIAPAIPEWLVGDNDRVRQVIMNLAGNAIKFTERGEVAVGVEKAGETSEGIELHFSVRDTGIGIPAAKLQSIFEAFVQADASTTRQHGGTGLGLAISKRLVELMEGRIWAESEPGKGSTFHFTLRLRSAPHPPESPKPPAGTLDGVPVLVVDDNATNRCILLEFLSGWAMKPAAVDNGWLALVALESARQAGEAFPLVILDVNMPGMDGFEVAQRIEQNPALGGATIMMLSSATRPGDIARCKELGVAAYLTKPIRRDQVLEVITKVLHRAKAQPDAQILESDHRDREKVAGKRILLAEDNPVNQKVAQSILEKRGHTVIVAANGREAIAELERTGWNGFDLVLMDVQMPQMDGYAATAAIREHEKTSGAHLPILAMTAHAMKGDRERCLQAGMDGYISKPFQVQDLLHQVGQATRARTSEGGQPSAAPSGKSEPSRQGLLDFFEGDRDLMGEVVELFLRDYPRLLGNLREAAARADQAELERAAHALKSSVSIFGVPELRSLLEKMERSAREGDPGFGIGAMAEVEAKLQSLVSSLSETGSERCLANGA